MVREEIVNGRARRYYALTPAGRAALEAEATHLLAAGAVAQRRARI
jgi:DNA-binding PadR family transcriptional regulator